MKVEFFTSLFYLFSIHNLIKLNFWQFGQKLFGELKSQEYSSK